jgi:hypothetical protein
MTAADEIERMLPRLPKGKKQENRKCRQVKGKWYPKHARKHVGKQGGRAGDY